MARWLPLILVVAPLATAGCATPRDYSGRNGGSLFREIAPGAMTARPQDALSGTAGSLARLQSPAPEPVERGAPDMQLQEPPLPDPGLPPAIPDQAPLPSVPPAMDAPPDVPPLVSEFQAANGATVQEGSPYLRGLSSISRNRWANRMRAAPFSNAVNILDAAAAGRLPSGGSAQPGGLSSILRNRIQAEGEVEYSYPDIHDDPAKRYHDRFGIEEDHDRFLFPWLVNLIFEDRWLCL